MKHCKKKYAILMGLCFTTFLLTGCATIFSNPRGQDEVEARLADASPNETFTLKEVERNSGLPKCDTYYFESDERVFTMVVHSEVAQDELQGLKLPLFYKSIYLNYPGVVRQIYYDDAIDIIESSDLFVSGAVEWQKEDLEYLSSPINEVLTINEESDIDEAVSIIYLVSQLYSAEIEYNSEKWTKENPLLDITVSWGDEETKKNHKTVSLDTFSIDGLLSYEEIDERLRNSYNEKREEGMIP